MMLTNNVRKVLNYILGLILIIQVGCATSQELHPRLPQKERTPEHQSIASVISHYFTPAAANYLTDIPYSDGPTSSAYAAGVTVWSNIPSIMTGNGWGRKIIVSDESLREYGVGTVIHEYTHHLDDLDRDGECEFINHHDFTVAYELMSRDHKWKGICLWSEIHSASTSSYWSMIVSDWFGIGEWSEQIAYVAQHLATKGGPDYMKWVFRKILRVEIESRSFTYTDIDGNSQHMTLPEDE